MAQITDHGAITSATTFDETVINNRYVAFVDEFNGNIDNENIKSGAAIAPAKIADTAVVAGNTVSPGEQTVTRPTKVSGRVQFKEADLSGWSFDEDDTQAVALGGATTFALTAGKGAYTVTNVGAVTLATITGGTEGDVIYLLLSDTDVTVGHTAAATVDSFCLVTLANKATPAGGQVVRLRYSAFAGTGKWYEC